MFQSALLPSVRKAAIFGLICLFCLAIFLAFVPSSASASFHEVKKNVAGTAARSSPSPKAKPKPVSFNFSPTKLFSGAVKFLGLDDRSFGLPKAAAKPSPKPVAKAQVKGAQDKKSGENPIARFFKGIGNVLASIGDALWPFDGEKKLADKGTRGKAAASPAA